MRILRAMYFLLHQAVKSFLEDDVVTLAASVAFYTTLSLPPLLMILIAVFGLVGSGAQDHLVEMVETLVGPRGRAAMMAVIEHVRDAEQTRFSWSLSAALGVGVLLFSAAIVFAQLQKAMNRIWGLRTRRGRSLVSWSRKRLVSLGMVFLLGGLLAASMLLTAVMNTALPEGHEIWKHLRLGVSLALFAGLFAVTFKLLPDAKVPWSAVWLGSAATAGLLEVGRWGAEQLIRLSGVGSAYGAAGSLVALLVWLYYTSTIVFFGAELTKACAAWVGRGIRPYRHAELTEAARRFNERFLQRRGSR